MKAQTQADHSKEVEHIDTKAARPRPVSTTLKKCGKTPLWPPSPPLTSSKEAAGAALSSGM